MSAYQKVYGFLSRYFEANSLLKHGLNLSPMYRRTNGRVEFVSSDLRKVTVRIPYSFRNKNYVGSIFGGSLFATTNPIIMKILGKDFVVWDKSSYIRFKRPAFDTVYAYSEITESELDRIREEVIQKGETDFITRLDVVNKDRTVVYCEIEKTIYVADKAFYKAKRKAKADAASRGLT